MRKRKGESTLLIWMEQSATKPSLDMTKKQRFFSVVRGCFSVAPLTSDQQLCRQSNDLCDLYQTYIIANAKEIIIVAVSCGYDT